MKWEELLKYNTFIAKKLGVTVHAVKKWSKNNYVPATRFEALQIVLASLGHNISTIEMRKINEKEHLEKNKWRFK